MRKTMLGLAVLAGVGMWGGSAEARRLGSLEFEACSLTSAMSTEIRAAQCTTLEVPEDPAKPDGRKISLAIAWVPATGDEVADPVFMLAGGPGQSARESFPGIAGVFREVLRKRHVILVDQRGTGGSNPLVCRDEAGRAGFGDASEDTVEANAAFAARCRDALSNVADLRLYTTTEAIADLDAVRQAIGAEQVNLVGISYGTRVAQQYAMRYPAHTRSLVLDGVVPNDLVLGSEHARSLEDALQIHSDRCSADPACRERFGEPLPRLHEQIARLREAPVQVRFRDAVSAEWREEAFGYGHLAVLARMFSYSPTTAAMLPLIVHEAAEGRFDTLAAQANLLMGSLGESINHGMQLSVSCTEDADELVVDPADEARLMGTAFIEFTRAQCAEWPRGQRPADFRSPLDGDLPVLLASGEFDPVTPPRYGDAVAAHLPNSRHLVLAGQGHNVIPVGCMPRLMARFIDTGDAKGLDAGCLDGLSAPAPFTGFHGWEP